MRPQHPGNALRKTCQTQKYERQRQKAHLLGAGSEQRSTQDQAGTGLKEKRHPRPPISPRMNSKLRSAGLAEAGFPQAVVTCCVAEFCETPLGLIRNRTTSRSPPAAGLRILVFGTRGPAPDSLHRADHAGGALPLDARTSGCMEPMKARPRCSLRWLPGRGCLLEDWVRLAFRAW